MVKEVRAESPAHIMPQSLDKVLLHIVLSTKDWAPCLGNSVRPALHPENGNGILQEATKITEAEGVIAEKRKYLVRF